MCKRRKAWLGVALALLAVACSAHRTRVDCDGHLKAINAPAAVTATAKTHP
jgi:hypothetical protein